MYNIYEKLNDCEIVHVKKHEDGYKSTLNMAIIRWAMGAQVCDFKSTMVLEGTTSVIRRKYFGMLTGAVAFFSRIYIINFTPKSNIIEWRQATEDDIWQYDISRKAWDDYDAAYEQKERTIVPSGYIQDDFIARLIEHVIRISPWWKRADVRKFYARHQWPNRRKLRDIPIPFLTRKNKEEICFFLVIVSIIDPSIKWKRSGDTGTCTFTLIGRIQEYFRGRPLITTKISYANCEWDMDNDKVHWYSSARCIFWNMQNLVKNYQNSIKNGTQH